MRRDPIHEAARAINRLIRESAARFTAVPLAHTVRKVRERAAAGRLVAETLEEFESGHLPEGPNGIPFDAGWELEDELRRFYGCRRGLCETVDGELAFTWRTYDREGRRELDLRGQMDFEAGRIPVYFHTFRYR